jgi:hypothetical protein
MTLIMKYERINFFGKREYTEDSTEYPIRQQVTRAFTFLSKEKESAIELYDGESIVLYWDNYNDFENRIITLRHSRTWNDIDIIKIEFDKAKKQLYKRIEGD